MAAFRRSKALRYSLAVVLSLLASLARWGLDPLLRATGEYLTAYFSVLLTAVVAGTVPGAVAVVLGAVLGKGLFIHLGHTAGVFDDNLRLFLFLLYGATAVMLVERVRRSEQRAGALQDAALFPEESPHPTFRLNTEGRFLFANPACARLLTCTCVAGAEAPGAAREAARAVLRGDASPHELELPGRDGTIFSFAFSASPDRRHVNFYGRDVTEAREVQRALVTSESRLRAVMDHANALVWLKDLEGRFLMINRHAERVFLRPRTEMLGRTAADLFPGPVAEQQSANDRRVIETGAGLAFEEDFVEAGEARTYSSLKFPLRDGGGRLIGVGAICSDITERKRAEEAVRSARVTAERAQAAAEEASQAKDQFLAVLSHELRTPLSPVMTALALLQREPALPAVVRNYLAVVGRNVELEAHLIDDLLDLTAITRGKVRLDRRPVPLCTIVERAVEVCRPDIEARRLHFGVEYGPKRGQYMIQADAARLQQVFWNLLKNAIKFTPHGGCVGLRCAVADGQVLVEVSDSGTGIDPPDLERIFDAFAQAHRPSGQRFGGLGLGLAISRSLVEMHGGRIEAVSGGLNKGATFRVWLPTIPVAEAAPAAGIERTPARRSLEVLLVEDHGDTSDMMASMLSLEGHRVTTAADVASAFELASTRHFDLLLSDLGLPDASGLDLVRRLRERDIRVPAVALSGYGQEADIAQSRTVGFAAHLVKPVEPARLLDTMETIARAALQAGR